MMKQFLGLALIIMLTYCTPKLDIEYSKKGHVTFHAFQNNVMSLYSDHYGNTQTVAIDLAERNAMMKLLFEGIAHSPQTMPLIPNDIQENATNMEKAMYLLNSNKYKEFIVLSTSERIDQNDGHYYVGQLVDIDVLNLRNYLKRNGVISDFGLDNNNLVQPTLMVIPFAAEDSSLRTVYENNELLRIAITKVKNAIDNRGGNTIDLRAKLKQFNNAEIMTLENQSSEKDYVIGLSGADIYIEVEASKNFSSTGNSVNVIMTAYDASTSQSLANKVSHSAKFRTTDFERLTELAVDQEIDNLLNALQSKFNDIVENGRTISLSIGLAEKADFNFQNEIQNGSQLLLSELIEEWIKHNSLNKYYHIQGVSDTRLEYDQIKIPVRDSQGRSYSITYFMTDFRKFLNEHGIEANSDRVGNKLFYTLY